MAAFAVIDTAMKYIDTGRVGRDRAPRGPQSKHSENTLLSDCGALGDRPLPVKANQHISLPEQ